MNPNNPRVLEVAELVFDVLKSSPTNKPRSVESLADRTGATFDEVCEATWVLSRDGRATYRSKSYVGAEAYQLLWFLPSNS